MNPLVVFTGLAIACAGGLLALSYQQPEDSDSALVGMKDPAAGSDARQQAGEAKTASVEPKQDTADARQPASATGGESAGAADTPSAGAGQDAAVKAAPSFDIVRVEEDGSAVIAGRAEANSRVSIVIDGEVAGETQANERGEWVFVPEKSFEPGDHEVTLQQATGDGKVADAPQSVALKIPEEPSAQPLIVLSEAAKPSKVLQKPEETAGAKDDAMTGQENEQVAAVAPSATATQEGSQTTAPEPPAAAPQPAAQRDLTVDVVDYDAAGRTTFSGAAEPGSRVRVYVDETFAGEAVAGDDGRWTLAAETEIPPGNHRLRTDQIAADGGVSERIELPFFRETPERIASLQQQRAADQGDTQAQPAPAPADQSTDTADQQQDEPGTTGQQVAGETTSSTADGTSQPAQEQSGGQTAGGGESAAGSGTATASDSQQAQQAQQAQTGQAATAATDSATDAASGDAGTTGSPEPQQQVTATEPDTQAPAAPAPESAGSDDAGQSQTASTATGQAEPKDGRVVIQPGNNLWQISRVIYGQGVRYTIIYEANKDQIRDPDLIYPGQIFSTPGASGPEEIDPGCRQPLEECAASE